VCWVWVSWVHDGHATFNVACPSSIMRRVGRMMGGVKLDDAA